MRRLVAALLILIAAGSLAADDQFVVHIDSRIGFGGAFKPGRWTPVGLTLQNLGPEIRGTLVVELTRRDRVGAGNHTTSYERALDLASGAIKHFSYVLPLETAVYPIDIRILNQGVLVTEEEVKLTGQSTNEALVAVLSRRPNLDFLLPVFNSRTEHALDIVYPLIDSLPEQWIGYDGVDLVVVHDARIQDLTFGQLTGLREWVAAGGRLVVSAGSHVGPVDAEVLEELSGLRAESAVVSTVADLGLELVGLPVVAGERDGPVVVTQFRDVPPGVCYLPFGRGEIVVLPFDYAQLVRVAPVTSLGLWTGLLPRSAVLGEAAPDGDAIIALSDATGRADWRAGLVPIGITRRPFETDLLANQLDLPIYRFPNRMLVFGIAASFFLVAAALLFWMSARPSRRGAIAGAVLLVCAAGLTSVVVHVTLTVGQQPREALAFTLEIAELGPNDGYAVVTSDILLFSRQRADYRVAFEDSPVIVPIADSQQTLRTTGAADELEVAVGRWSYRNLLAVEVDPLDLRANVSRGVGYVNVELHNNTDLVLDGVVVLNNGFPSTMGTVMPDEIVETVIAGSAVGGWNDIDWDEYVTPGATASHRAQLLRDLAQRQRNGESGSVRPVLVVGFRSQPLLHTAIEPAFQRDVNVNAFIMRIDADGAHAGGQTL